MKNETRKQNLLRRLKVTKIGSGHYKWSLQMGNDFPIKWLSCVIADAQLYDRWNDETILLDELEMIAKKIRMVNS